MVSLATCKRKVTGSIPARAIFFFSSGDKPVLDFPSYCAVNAAIEIDAQFHRCARQLQKSSDDLVSDVFSPGA